MYAVTYFLDLTFLVVFKKGYRERVRTHVKNSDFPADRIEIYELDKEGLLSVSE
jgi:hypothetical protein